MMDWSLDRNEYDDDRNRKKGLWISLFLHALLFLLCLIPFAEEVPRPTEFQGVLVVFGNPDDGANDSAQLVEEDVEAETVEFEEVPEEIDDAEEVEELVEPEPTPVEPEKPVEVRETEVKVETPSIETETVQDNSDIIAAQKKAEEQKKKLAEAEAKKETQRAVEAKAKAAAKAKADAEAAAKAAAAKKAKELEEKKKQFGDLFGKGGGNDNGGGNTGDPLGDPDGEALEGISTGKGKIGGGLSNRGLIYEPEIADNSQKAGKVVVRVCVNRDGEVIEAKFTQQGSTTTDRTLVEIAEKAARKYKFSANQSDKQCGTVTIDFRLV